MAEGFVDIVEPAVPSIAGGGSALWLWWIVIGVFGSLVLIVVLKKIPQWRRALRLRRLQRAWRRGHLPARQAVFSLAALMRESMQRSRFDLGSIHAESVSPPAYQLAQRLEVLRYARSSQASAQDMNELFALGRRVLGMHR